MTRAFALILLCLLGSGCIAKIPYTPNGGLIEELGDERAIEDFTDLMTGSVRAPGVIEVEVTDFSPSLCETSHRRPITDLCWLPPEIEFSAAFQPATACSAPTSATA